MKSEMGFLLELFLNKSIPDDIKQAIAQRLEDIEAYMTGPKMTQPIMQPSRLVPASQPVMVGGVQQSPSMARILAQNPDLIPQGQNSNQEVPVPVQPSEQPAQPAIVAQTPAAIAALQQRQEAIRIATSGKEEKGRTSPRKF